PRPVTECQTITSCLLTSWPHAHAPGMSLRLRNQSFCQTGLYMHVHRCACVQGSSPNWLLC
ncbi:unnamed protein product, partial [Gulo gulo]